MPRSSRRPTPSSPRATRASAELPHGEGPVPPLGWYGPFRFVSRQRFMSYASVSTRARFTSSAIASSSPSSDSNFAMPRT